MNTNRVLGSALITVGTSIGAGMLALPMVGATSGFLMSATLITVIWALMTLAALIVLEINLTFPKSSSSFDAMTYKILGKTGRVVTWITLLCLHYALLAAYSSGATVLFDSLIFNTIGIQLPNWSSTLIFVGVLGGAVFWSTQAVDYTNRFFISFKGLFLIASIILLMPHVDLAKVVGTQTICAGKYLGVAAPIFLGAFGFIATIPSIRLYVGDRRKELRLIIICSTTFSLVLYLLWLWVNLGVVPLAGKTNSFTAIGGSIDGLIGTITAIVKNEWVTVTIRGFVNIAMTTSFLGVALGLFDFLAEGCKRKNTRSGRLQTALITFIPPLIFAIYYPKGFIVALGYAALCVAILEVIMPAVMAYKLQKQNATLLKNNRWLFNKYLLFGMVVIGMAIIVLEVMNNLRLLPV